MPGPEHGRGRINLPSGGAFDEFHVGGGQPSNGRWMVPLWLTLQGICWWTSTRPRRIPQEEMRLKHLFAHCIGARVSVVEERICQGHVMTLCRSCYFNTRCSITKHSEWKRSSGASPRDLSNTPQTGADRPETPLVGRRPQMVWPWKWMTSHSKDHVYSISMIVSGSVC